MALDPTYGLDPTQPSDVDYDYLALLDEQLRGPQLPMPAPGGPAVPVDTVLLPRRGTNNREPGAPTVPPPDVPPAPPPEAIGLAPPPPGAIAGEVAAPAVDATTGAAPAAAPVPSGAPPDVDLGPPSTGINWLDDQLSGRAPQAPPDQRDLVDPYTAADDDAGIEAELGLGADPNVVELQRFNRDTQRDDIYNTRARSALEDFRAAELAAAKEHEAAKQRNEASLAAIETEAKALNNKEIDNGHWWSSRSTFQQIAAILAATLGGYSAVRTGRNAPLELIQHAIDQDIETQKANLGNKRASIQDRRNALAQAFDRLGDMDRAAAAVRVASYDKAISEAQTEAQQFDPRGTQAQTRYDLINGLVQKRAQAWQDAADKSLDNEIKRGEYNLKVSAENRALAKDAARAAGVGASSNDFNKREWSPDELAAISPGQPVPPVPMKFGDYKNWLLAQKAGNEVQATKLAGGVSEEQRKRLIGDLTQPDGTPFLANGETTAIDKLKARYEAAHTVARALDNVLALRTGWTSDAIKSAEWQRVKQEYTTAIGLGKDVLGLGALSGPDMALIENFLGGTDPTGVRDPSAGIKQARESVLNLVRDNLKGAGYKEPGRFTIPNLADLKRREVTPEEKALDGNLEWQTNAAAIGKTPDVITGYTGQTHTEESIRADQRGFSDGQKAYADGLAKTVKDAKSTPEQRATALEQLKQIETKALSPGYRAYATKLTAPKVFDIANPPAPYDPDYQAFKEWYRAKYDRPYLDERVYPEIRGAE